MIVMGITGTFDRSDESAFSKSGVHDASATLVEDGKIVAAVEEERFNRYKHSGKMPIEAMRYCLSEAGVSLGQVDKFVFNVLESDVNQSLETAYRFGMIGGFRLGRPFIQQLLKREFGCNIDPSKFEFIDHHYAHAVSAFLPSGFSESLVVTLDGMGAGLAGSIWIGEDTRLTHVRSYKGLPHPTTQSLGHFYTAITAFLGFGNFDEYKVMGLAPYGDRSRFRPVFDQFYALKDQGDYEVYLSRLDLLLEICPRRGRHEPVEQVHQDIAAALQEALEILVFHILEFHQRTTGAQRLCLAGGVAHNCAVNGKVLGQGLFREAYVQPASHDGGLSLGAALHGYYSNGAKEKCSMPHAFLGPSCGADTEIERELSLWEPCIEYEKTEDVEGRTAQMIAEGLIVGWVQGRAEFGPRALGNRSIVADPGPAENKDIINAMIKKREAFRPFAPSVLEECAERYFELPPCQKRFPYMVFVVKVKEEFRKDLGAITHVDGTARIQTVSRASNEKYWKLIKAFGDKTGVPILLNTSFNNNAEPIVTSPRDSIVCYLTTDLNVLVIGNYIIRKRPVDKCVYRDFKLSLPITVRLHRLELRSTSDVGRSRPTEADDRFFMQLFQSLYDPDPMEDHFLGNTHDARRTGISADMARMLARADGYKSFGELAEPFDEPARTGLLDEVLNLWGKRLVHLSPR